MSIFKFKKWWSNDTLQNEEPSTGVLSGGCIKVDKFASHSNSDCILFGEGSLLKIYKPSKDDGSHSLLESQLSDSILQIETGKCVAGSSDRQIIVLHPQRFIIYQLKRQEGHTDAGEQNLLQSVLKQSFTRRAYSLTCGPFGNVKSRDLLCVQGLDGSLSFFDQDMFLFICLFNDVIVPAPVAYIASSDSFVICKSTWIIEIYSYQQLRDLSEVNVRQNKKNIPQWTYNAGEEISHVQVIQSSNNFSSILAMGERHLCCFQDNGLMKYMIKFDFMPICFCAYLIGWYYEPTARLLVMVVSEDSKLFIYEGTSLLWSCDLPSSPIAIARCYLPSLPGGLVTLSATGIVNVSYLGTEPDLNSNAPTMINDPADPEEIQAELKVVENTLQNILENKDEVINESAFIDQIVKIKADVGKPQKNVRPEFSLDDNDMHSLLCPVIVIVTCEEPKLIQKIQITYVCNPPFACSDGSICLDTVNGTDIIETQVFVSSKADIGDTRVRVLFTITDSAGKIIVLSRSVLLPMSLYCLPVEIATDSEIKLDIYTNDKCIDLTTVFTDFSEDDLSRFGSANAVSFSYVSTNKIVTIRIMTDHYVVEANNFSELTAVFENFIINLSEQYKRMEIKNFKLNIRLDKESLKQVIHTFLKTIEMHARERVELKKIEDELSILQKQFILVQKKLLVQYGSLPPGDCDPLEYLMRDTHERLIASVHNNIQHRDVVCRAGCSLTATGRLIVCLLRQTTTDDFKIKLIEEMMALNTIYDNYQEWEETVAQALSYIINRLFKHSDKDKEKLAAVTEQGILSHVNLKRFMKQIRMVMDNVFSEHWEENTENTKVTRIEELVEVF